MSIRAHLATHLGDEVEAPIRLVFTKPQLGVRGEGILGCIQDSCHVVITTTRNLQHTPVEYTGYVNIAAGLGGCVCVCGGGGGGGGVGQYSVHVGGREHREN